MTNTSVAEREPPTAASSASVSARAEAPANDDGAPAALPKNLAPVLAIIPPTCYENPTWKGMAYVARDTVVYGAVLAALALVDTWWLLVPLWIVSAFAVSGMFILGHDAAHGALFKSKRLNGIVGRFMMLPSLHVYDSWVFGHNRLHHGHTVRQGVDFVWHPLTIEDWSKLGVVGRALVRLEWSWAGAGIYYGRNIWLNMMRYKQPDSMAKGIHRDQLFVWSFVALASALFGWIGWSMYGTATGAAWMWFKLLLVPFVGFLYTIAIAVYVHHIEPDIRWYSRAAWNKFKGQMEGTTIWSMPPGLDFFFHNIMVHVPHHVDMRIPFYHLPEAADAIVEAYPDVVRKQKFSLLDYVRHTRACKLYDFQENRWLPYTAAQDGS